MTRCNKIADTFPQKLTIIQNKKLKIKHNLFRKIIFFYGY